jgi:hypothetical protein
MPNSTSGNLESAQKAEELRKARADADQSGAEAEKARAKNEEYNRTLSRNQPEAESMGVIQGTGTLCEVYPVRRCGSIKRWPVHERIELPLNP